MTTLQDLLIQANSYLDLAAEVPSGDDLTVRINYAQQAVNEWASTYKWRQLKSKNSYFVTGATVSLPDNFRELLSPPVDTNKHEYNEIPLENSQYVDSSERYCYVDGSQLAGHSLIMTPLASGASISVAWQRYPSNMATLSDVCEVPDPEYVKWKIISYTLQSRSDERFPIVDAEANRVLSNMIKRESVRLPGGKNFTPKSGSSAWKIGTPRGR
jgi:hypothetical protein